MGENQGQKPRGGGRARPINIFARGDINAFVSPNFGKTQMPHCSDKIHQFSQFDIY